MSDEDRKQERINWVLALLIVFHLGVIVGILIG